MIRARTAIAAAGILLLAAGSFAESAHAQTRRPITAADCQAPTVWDAGSGRCRVKEYVIGHDDTDVVPAPCILTPTQRPSCAAGVSQTWGMDAHGVCAWKSGSAPDSCAAAGMVKDGWNATLCAWDCKPSPCPSPNLSAKPACAAGVSQTWDTATCAWKSGTVAANCPTGQVRDKWDSSTCAWTCKPACTQAPKPSSCPTSGMAWKWDTASCQWSETLAVPKPPCAEGERHDWDAANCQWAKTSVSDPACTSLQSENYWDGSSCQWRSRTSERCARRAPAGRWKTDTPLERPAPYCGYNCKELPCPTQPAKPSCAAGKAEAVWDAAACSWNQADAPDNCASKSPPQEQDGWNSNTCSWNCKPKSTCNAPDLSTRPSCNAGQGYAWDKSACGWNGPTTESKPNCAGGQNATWSFSTCSWNCPPPPNCRPKPAAGTCETVTRDGTDSNNCPIWRKDTITSNTPGDPCGPPCKSKPAAGTCETVSETGADSNGCPIYTTTTDTTSPGCVAPQPCTDPGTPTPANACGYTYNSATCKYTPKPKPDSTCAANENAAYNAATCSWSCTAKSVTPQPSTDPDTPTPQPSTDSSCPLPPSGCSEAPPPRTAFMNIWKQPLEATYWESTREWTAISVHAVTLGDSWESNSLCHRCP